MTLKGVLETSDFFQDHLSDNAIMGHFRNGANMIAYDESNNHKFKNRTGRFQASIRARQEGDEMVVGPVPRDFTFDGVVYYPIYVADRGYYDIALNSMRGLAAIESALHGNAGADAVPLGAQFRPKETTYHGFRGKQIRLGMLIG